MEVKLKEIIHHYLGCECEMKYVPEFNPIVRKLSASYLLEMLSGILEVKPILRPLSSMTKEEMEECGNMIYDFSDDEELNKWTPLDFEIGLAPEQFLWLLSKHFDLFGLIESSQAINKSSIK